MTRITYEGAADTSPSCTLIPHDTHSDKRTVFLGQWRVKKEDDASRRYIHKQAGALIKEACL